VQRSLASRIRLLVIGLCLGFGLTILIAFRILSGWQIREAARRDVESTSWMLSAFLKDRTKLLESLIRLDATEPRVIGLLGTDASTVGSEMHAMREEARVDALTMTDENGVVLGEDGFRTSQPDFSKQIGFSTAIGGSVWSGISVRDDQIYIASTAPIKVGTYVKATLTGYLRLGKDFALELKDRAPLELAFVHNGKATAWTMPLDTISAALMKQGEWSQTFRGQEYSASYTSMPGSDPTDNVGVIVMRPLEDIVGPFRTFSYVFLSFLGLVAAVTLIGGSIFGAGVARSLDGVVRAAQELQAGRWPAKFDSHRSDEIGLLERTFNEMTEAVRGSQDRLVAMLDVDPLTELDNHRCFKEKLELEAARTTAEDQTLALLLLDVDHFADYNRLHGPQAGDRTLQDIAGVLRALRPEFGTISRFGGEEFAVLIPRGTIADAEDLFRHIRRALKGVTVSGGCAELSSARGRFDGLVAASELALQRAKQLGRDQVCEFSSVPGADDDEPMMLYRHLQDGTYATVRALAAAVDAKDAYTHGHSDRVAKLAAQLATFVGAEQSEVEKVLRCGTLHDVGKIGVPDAILQKSSCLDAEETRVMQSHSVLGEFIVGKVPQLSELLPGVRHHHERYDGGGYPDGLKGEAIPRIARFLAVADTFDAMTSDRPYRKGLAPEKALEEIERNAGTQFDPEFALAFVKMMR